jgi:hypothetical protein
MEFLGAWVGVNVVAMARAALSASEHSERSS